MSWQPGQTELSGTNTRAKQAVYCLSLQHREQQQWQQRRDKKQSQPSNQKYFRQPQLEAESSHSSVVAAATGEQCLHEPPGQQPRTTEPLLPVLT